MLSDKTQYKMQNVDYYKNNFSGKAIARLAIVLQNLLATTFDNVASYIDVQDTIANLNTNLSGISLAILYKLYCHEVTQV